MRDDMRIVSPVDNFAETSMLLDAGADELYGGYIPQDWQERYSLLTSLNQRTFAAAQIATEDELRAVVDEVHARGKSFALTLNAPFYADEQRPLLFDYLDRMVEIGVDGLILADLGLLRDLRERYPPVEFHASTLAHLSNAGSVRFFAGQGMGRVILQRHLSVAEMGDIIKSVPGVRCDAFLLVGKCPNTEGLCTFHHVSPDRVWPCEVPYTISPVMEQTTPELQDAIRRQNSWSTTDRRHGCGLCAIPHLLEAGVFSAKLVGRGAPGAQKASNITLAREFITLARGETDFEVYRQQAMAAHQKHFGAVCHPNVCYYPEYYPGWGE